MQSGPTVPESQAAARARRRKLTLDATTIEHYGGAAKLYAHQFCGTAVAREHSDACCHAGIPQQELKARILGPASHPPQPKPKTCPQAPRPKCPNKLSTPRVPRT